MGSPGSVPSSLLAFGRPPPLGAGPPAPPCPAPPAGAVLPRTSSPRALESGPPEATDLLGAQRLSGYPAGARLMAAARGAAAKTNRSTRSPTAPRSEAPEPPRGPAEHHTAGARLARLRPGPARPGPGARSPGLRRLPAQSPSALPSPPGPGPGPPPTARPAGSAGPAGARLGPGVCPPRPPARRGAGAASRPPPATYRPPCPAPSSRALRVQPRLGSAGRRAPTPGALRRGGRSSGGRRAGSNYPLVRLLT